MPTESSNATLAEQLAHAQARIAELERELAVSRHQTVVSDPLFTQPANSILESITDAFIALDREFRYIWVNAEAERLLRISRDQLIGHCIWDVFPAAAGTPLEQKARQALRKQVTVEFENYYQPWDRWFHNRAYPTREGGLAIYWRDITDQKRLLADQRRQALELEQVHDSIIATDLDGNITRWNHGAERVFGYTPEDVLGRHITLLYFEEDRPQVAETVLGPLFRDGQRQIELRNRRKSGEECYIRLSLSLLRDEADRVYGMLGVAIDITEQRRAEQSLRQSEEQYRCLVDAMPQIAYSASPDGQTRMIGRRWEEYSGVPAERSLGLEWLSSIHPDDIEPVRSRWSECLRTGESLEMTYRVRNGKGEYRWHLSRCVPVRGTNGEITQWVGILTDIHDRKNVEEQLRVSEERMRLAQEAAGFGHFDWDLRTGKTIWSDTLKRILGRDPTPGTSLSDKISWVHPDDRAAFRTQLDEAIAGRTPKIRLTYRSTAPDGSLSWRICEANIHVDAEQKPSRIIGVIADITAHKRAEEAHQIENERKRLESVIFNLTEAVAICDSKGLFLSMNPAAQQMFDVDDSDIARRTLARFGSLFEATRPDGSILRLEDWPATRAMAGERVVAVEVRTRSLATGRTWDGAYSAVPIHDEEGNVAMVVISVRDITAERAATEEIRRANAALHALSGRLLRLQDEERKRIARELHDGTLQTITALSMNLLLIARSPNVIGDPQTRNLITEAQEFGKRFSLDLRTLSYLLHPPDLEELGLIPALRSWADGFAHRTGIILDVLLDDPGRLDPDTETALFRIAQESLANVHKHSGSPRAALRLKTSESEIQLEVKDDGCGFPTEFLSSASERIGVGIMGMRERARQLGGSLHIGCDGFGTTVRATLPRGASQ